MNRVLRKLLQTKLSEEHQEDQLRRIMFVETNIMVPVKLVAILMALYFYQTFLRFAAEAGVPADAVAVYFAQLKFYGAGNLLFWILLLAARAGQTWPRILRFSAFMLAVLDNLFLSGLVYFTGGLESVLYWVYIGLMIRSAVDFPVFWQQTLLNLSTCIFYTMAVLLSEESIAFLGNELYWMRLMILLLVGACCWGVYVLVEREKRRATTQQEFQLRAQKMAAAGRLAAEVAHQLKNPLGIINNAAYLLQRSNPNNGAQHQAVDVIREEVGRADKILTQLMDYSRLSEGRIENLSINAVLETVLAHALPDGLDRKVDVEKHLAEGLPRLAAQRAQLEECFLNLIQNAIEAMPDGGRLDVRTRYAGDSQIEVTISDSGRGIAPEVLPKVFDAFFTTKSTGTGLGLAIVKNVVETYDGSIAATSEPGKGTQFRVLLPALTKR
jgi:signal transduction histidine kinase